MRRRIGGTARRSPATSPPQVSRRNAPPHEPRLATADALPESVCATSVPLPEARLAEEVAFRPTKLRSVLVVAARRTEHRLPVGAFRPLGSRDQGAPGAVAAVRDELRVLILEYPGGGNEPRPRS